MLVYLQKSIIHPVTIYNPIPNPYLIDVPPFFDK